MARTVIGLDIGTSAIRAAEIRGKDPAALARFAQVGLTPGTVVNGEITDADAVASAIKDLWRRGEFRGKQVAVAVANQNVVVRQIEVPRLEEADLRSALQFQVADVIPMPIEDTLLDHLVLDEFVTDAGEEMLRLLVVAAHKDMVAAVMHAVTNAGLEPVAVDLAPLAAVRTFTPMVPGLLESGAEAIIDIGAGVTTVVVHAQGTPRFVRILSGGGDDITNALIEHAQVTRDDAEAQKIAIGLHPEGIPLDGPARIIETAASGAIDDVRRSLDYYASQPGALTLTRALIIGGGSQLPGLGARLADALRMTVERGRVLDHVAHEDLGLAPDQLDDVSSVSAVAVGLALESS